MDDSRLLEQITSHLEKHRLKFLPDTELSSIEVVLAAVEIERLFNIQFMLDEIIIDNFSSPEKILALVKSKLSQP